MTLYGAVAFRDIVGVSVPAVASSVTQLGKPLSDVRERDLQAAVVSVAPAAAERLFKMTFSAATASVQWEEWPGVGPVDVRLQPQPSGVPIYWELKWGATAPKLEEAVWDVAKLSVAVARREVAGAFLVYGGPAEAWRRSLALPFFEEKRTWKLEELRSRFERDWRFWQRDVRTRPVRLPAEIVVQPMALQPLFDDGVPWELRATEVAAVSSDEVSWRGFP